MLRRPLSKQPCGELKNNVGAVDHLVVLEWEWFLFPTINMRAEHHHLPQQLFLHEAVHRTMDIVGSGAMAFQYHRSSSLMWVRTWTLEVLLDGPSPCALPHLRRNQPLLRMRGAQAVRLILPSKASIGTRRQSLRCNINRPCLDRHYHLLCKVVHLSLFMASRITTLTIAKGGRWKLTWMKFGEEPLRDMATLHQ